MYPDFNEQLDRPTDGEGKENDVHNVYIVPYSHTKFHVPS